jgi:hypothetical protein
VEKWKKELVFFPSLGYSKYMRGTVSCALVLWFFSGQPLAAQADAGAQEAVLYGNPVQFVGMTVPALLQALGPPASVYAARGGEAWQDDVVFAYERGEFYLYKDHVWQASLKSAFGIQAGDPKAAVLLVLGEDALDEGNSVTVDVPGLGWPMRLRVDFNRTGKTSAIFLYRPDY